MDLGKSSTALFVKDIETSKKFYSDILGMETEMDFGKNVIFKNGLAIWEIEPRHIIPQSIGLENISARQYNRFELYFETEDLTGIFNTLKSRNVAFLHEIHEEPWGQRTIRIFDPDNHLIEIGDSMKQFVTRLYNEGLSMEDVSNRTSVPLKDVRRMIGS